MVASNILLNKRGPDSSIGDLLDLESPGSVHKLQRLVEAIARWARPEGWPPSSASDRNLTKAIGQALAAFEHPAGRGHAVAKIMENHYAGLFAFLIVMGLAVMVVLFWFWLRMRASAERNASAGAKEASAYKTFEDSGEPQPDAQQPSGAAAGGAQGVLLASQPLTPQPSSVAGGGLQSVLLTKFNTLLILVPIGWASHLLGGTEIATFLLSLFGMLPLACLIGEATEELSAALGVGPIIGGFINATCGNTVEFVIMVQAMINGRVGTTKGALLGSIINNNLLVLGAAVLFGGLVESGGTTLRPAVSKEQRFTGSSAMIFSQVTLFAAFCLAVPSFFQEGKAIGDSEATLLFSRAGSAVVLLGYVTFMVFQLGTHADLMRGDEHGIHKARITATQAAMLMIGTTLIVALTAHVMVHAMEGFIQRAGISNTFVSVILLPLVGNACEHSVAVIMALRDNMDLAIGISVGSAVQISLFGVPFMVLIGWALDKPMDLNFHPRNALILVLSALLVTGTMGMGRTNWLHGFMLVGAYLLLSILFFFAPDGPI
uniref:Sodium/calcium exchanger membrane region domain-containing protein n=1 Tax=Alexandrium catenella TaxID=2925 RepID=A0A7S1SGE7_ALECA|mmetsp:Transcript_99498/g.264444  ORF Transcript_99498/g.264444 Transcript_99498/m.264444 type:complete len:546 (+) Transcript_99498:80-1717(+)